MADYNTLIRFIQQLENIQTPKTNIANKYKRVKAKKKKKNTKLIS